MELDAPSHCHHSFFFGDLYLGKIESMVVEMVPLKGGGIVHPPIGRKNTTYRVAPWMNWNSYDGSPRNESMNPVIFSDD